MLMMMMMVSLCVHWSYRNPREHAVETRTQPQRLESSGVGGNGSVTRGWVRWHLIDIYMYTRNIIMIVVISGPPGFSPVSQHVRVRLKNKQTGGMKSYRSWGRG